MGRGGLMKVSITQLRANIYNVVSRLKRTGDVEITHKGKVVAKLVKVGKDETN